MLRLQSSPNRVGERIEACRRRIRERHQAPARRASRLQKSAEREEQAVTSSDSSEMAEGAPMSSVAEILSAALGEMGWLKEGSAPGVDERTPGTTGLSLTEELGEEVGTR